MTAQSLMKDMVESVKAQEHHLSREVAQQFPRICINECEWAWRDVCPAYALRVEHIVDPLRFSEAVNKLCNLYKTLLTARVDAQAKQLVLCNKGLTVQFAKGIEWSNE